jgi:hypothetical protein
VVHVDPEILNAVFRGDRAELSPKSVYIYFIWYIHIYPNFMSLFYFNNIKYFMY